MGFVACSDDVRRWSYPLANWAGRGDAVESLSRAPLVMGGGARSKSVARGDDDWDVVPVRAHYSLAWAS